MSRSNFSLEFEIKSHGIERIQYYVMLYFFVINFDINRTIAII